MIEEKNEDGSKKGSSQSCVGNLCESSVCSVTLWWQSVTIWLKPVADDIPPQRHRVHRVRTERLTNNSEATVTLG